jgi:hypothetical protein
VIVPESIFDKAGYSLAWKKINTREYINET